MSWPAANVSLANVGAASNRISSARADIEDAFTKLNEIITEGPAIEAVAVSGQSTISANVSNVTLTLVAGANVVLTTNTETNSVTIDSTGGLADIVNDTSPSLGGDLDVGTFKIQSGIDNFVRVNDTLVALDGVAAMAGDTSFSGNSVTMNMITDSVAKIFTNNVSSSNPAGVRLDISGDQINIDPYNGTTKISVLELSQTTGTPSNTATPTGYINVTINGTTRFIPFFT